MSTRTPFKGRPAALPARGARMRAVDSIPTVEEAKRRLAAAAGRDRPWLTMSAEDAEAMTRAEDAAGGWLVGPEVYRPPEAE